MLSHLVTRLQWRLARWLHAGDAIVLNYRWPRFSV
jgi:hypothetical protein